MYVCVCLPLKMDEQRDLKDFNKGQIVTGRQLGQSITGLVKGSQYTVVTTTSGHMTDKQDC